VDVESEPFAPSLLFHSLIHFDPLLLLGEAWRLGVLEAFKYLSYAVYPTIKVIPVAPITLSLSNMVIFGV
jgi:hypothetical protein